VQVDETDLAKFELKCIGRKTLKPSRLRPIAFFSWAGTTAFRRRLPAIGA
jgi:hypothetical protein